MKAEQGSIAAKLKCKIYGHTWEDGCKCMRCGTLRDEGHDFQYAEGKCEQSCSVCGANKTLPHQWIEGKCARCGIGKGLSNKKNWIYVGIGAFAVLMAIFIVVMALLEANPRPNSNGEIKVPSSSAVFEDQNYEDVVHKLQQSGFTNIEEKALGDLITGWLKSDGEVKEVEVNGRTDYSTSSWYPKDVKIVVSYHSFPTDEKIEETEKDERAEEISQDEDVVDDGSRAIYDNAIGKMAIDVYNELNDLGYTVNFKNAKTKMEYTDSVILYESNPEDTSSYIPWLITGVNLYSATSKTASFFIDTQERMDEVQEKKTAAEILQTKLDRQYAWQAVESHGKGQYHYGFKLRWFAGKLAETAEDENTWFLKAYCDVRNAYGIWEEGLECEARVTGTTESPRIVDFKVY